MANALTQFENLEWQRIQMEWKGQLRTVECEEELNREYQEGT